MIGGFSWKDGERTIHFGRGRLADAPGILGDGYALLTTERGRDAAPDVVAAAATVHDVPPGTVDELAAALVGEVPAQASLVVGLGGGRVIDTAKAIAALHRTRAAAIPTTLSAAEMTWVHRLPAGTPDDVQRVRPQIVVNDPALSASQPEAELAASAANSLAHAIEGAVTTMTSPVPRLVAAEAIRLTRAAYEADALDDDARDRLALAAVLSGSVIDSAWYGLHHVMSQTLVRLAGAGHGPANAAMLPHTAAALASRPGGEVAPEAIALARTLADLAGASRLRDLGVERDALAACADAAAGRAELDLTPPRATRDELLGLYEAAW
jgi:alcohol dehydrogenase class IV